MRTWLAPLLVVLAVLWVWWLRGRLRSAFVRRIIDRARGSVGRARTITVAWQSGVLALEIVLIGAAIAAQQLMGWAPVRVILLLLVLVVIVPLGTLAGGRDETRGAITGRARRFGVRRSAQRRLVEAGVDAEVANVVVRVSRPFGYATFLLGVLAAILLVWHD